MPITLESKARQIQVFNLPHEIYCEAAGHCRCEQQTVTTLIEDPLTGERTPRSVIRRIPASITLLAGASEGNLSEAALQVPEIQRALEKGALRVRTEATTQPEATSRRARTSDKAESSRRSHPRSE